MPLSFCLETGGLSSTQLVSPSEQDEDPVDGDHIPPDPGRLSSGSCEDRKLTVLPASASLNMDTRIPRRLKSAFRSNTLGKLCATSSGNKKVAFAVDSHKCKTTKISARLCKRLRVLALDLDHPDGLCNTIKASKKPLTCRVDHSLPYFDDSVNLNAISRLQDLVEHDAAEHKMEDRPIRNKPCDTKQVTGYGLPAAVFTNLQDRDILRHAPCQSQPEKTHSIGLDTLTGECQASLPLAKHFKETNHPDSQGYPNDVTMAGNDLLELSKVFEGLIIHRFD